MFSLQENQYYLKKSPQTHIFNLEWSEARGMKVCIIHMESRYGPQVYLHSILEQALLTM